MTLLIAMPGPPLPAKGGAPAAARDALPALPHLTRLLGAARPLPSSRDWRAGVLAGLHGGDAAAWPEAMVAARGLPAIAAGTPLCFAAPLHMVAGISRVHLPPEGLLQLAPDEREDWRAAFNQEFGGGELALQAVPGGWLLTGPAAGAARDAAPEQLLGRALERVPARDDAERALRRLGTEVEMWLAAHPLNAAREARRLPPVNSFWFWAGASATVLPPLAQPPRTIHGPAQPDAWLAGLARHAGLEGVKVAEGWNDVQEPARALVVPALETGGDARAQWQSLEARWFEPLWRALAARQVRGLRLQVGASAWQLPAAAPLRWLRRLRARAWWEMLQQ